MPYPSNGRLANQNRFGVFNATDKVARGGIDYGKLEGGNTVPIPGPKPSTSGNGLFLNVSPGQGGTPQVNVPNTATSQRFSSQHKQIQKQGSSGNYRASLGSRGNSQNPPAMNLTGQNFTNMIGGIQKVPTSGSNNMMNKTGFDFTQKFEKSELSSFLAKAPGKKVITPKNETE